MDTFSAGTLAFFTLCGLATAILRDDVCVRDDIFASSHSVSVDHISIGNRNNRKLHFVEAKVCCDELGCFSSGPPFHDRKIRPLHATPNCALVKDLKFRLNTLKSSDPNNPETVNKSNITSSNFSSSQKTILIIHGYLDHFQSDSWKDLVVQLLKDGDHNVIRMDWSAGNGMPYTQATANLRLVGAFVGQFLLHLKDHHGLNPQNVHLVGHSLGAHGAGYAGSYLKTKNITIGRITGLDPAGPFFTGTERDVRLDPTDAIFVDTIITDAGSVLLRHQYGSEQSMGHINFLPNGGKFQPGCEVPRFIWESSCSHARAVRLFSESIHRDLCKTRSYQCSSYQTFLRGECFNCTENGCATMGYYAEDSLAEGITEKNYFTITSERPPFFSRERLPTCSTMKPYQIAFTVDREDGASHLEHSMLTITLTGHLGSTKVRLTTNGADARHGKRYTYLFELATEIGNIESATLNWVHKESIWTRFLPNFLYSRDVQLEGDITVTNGTGYQFVLMPSHENIQKKTGILASLKHFLTTTWVNAMSEL